MQPKASNGNLQSQDGMHRTGGPTGWGVVSACVMQCTDVSLELRAVLSIIATLPPSWSFHLGWLRAKTGWGRNKTQRVMAEAREWGFAAWHVESCGDRTIRSYYEWCNARDWEEIVKNGKKPRNSRLPGFSTDELDGSLSRNSTQQSKSVVTPMESPSMYAGGIDDSVEDTSSLLSSSLTLDSRLREEKHTGSFAENAKDDAPDAASLASKKQNQNLNEEELERAPTITDRETFELLGSICDNYDIEHTGTRNQGRKRRLYDIHGGDWDQFEESLVYAVERCSVNCDEDPARWNAHVWSIAIQHAKQVTGYAC